MSGWSTYFPFAKGDKLVVDGPLIYNGKGVVLQNEGVVLELKIYMPKISIASIPEIDALVRIHHLSEGSGNEFMVSLNDMEITDHNATITSGGSTIRITPSLGDKWVEITRNGDRASLKVQGREFTISKTQS